MEDDLHTSQIIDRLIRLSRSLIAAQHVRPDEAAITAFLRGTPNSEQRKAVEEGIANSPAFRQELLHALKDIDGLETSAAGQASSDTRIHTPTRGEFLRRFRGTRRQTVPSIRKWAIAAALLIGVASTLYLVSESRRSDTRQSDTANQFTEASRVDPGLLRGKSLRGQMASEPRRAFASPDSAAIAAFRAHLKYRNGLFVPDTTRQGELYGSTPHVRIAFLDEPWASNPHFEPVWPLGFTYVDDKLQVWSLDLDELTLRAVGIEPGQVSLRSTDIAPGRIALCVTVGTDKGLFVASNVLFLESP